MPVSRNTRNGQPRPRQTRPPRRAPAQGHLSFKGGEYKLDTKMGIWPLLQFARAAEAGMEVTDARGLAAIHAFLQDVIDPDDWPRFQEDMIKKKVDDLRELLDAANDAVNQLLEAQDSKTAKAEIVSE
jgi:hypothetical protein